MAGASERPATPAETSRERTVRSLGRGTAVMMVATIVLVGLQFLTRVIVTRNVTGPQWGEFNLGLALANFLALVAAFGIPTATARSLAFEETHEARMRLIRKAIAVSVPVGAVTGLLVFLGAPVLAGVFHDPGLVPVFRLFALAVAFTELSNVLVGIFQGLERAEPNAIFLQIVNPSLFFLFTAGLLLAHWGFTGVLLGFTLSWAGAFGALALYTYRRLPRLLRELSGHVFTGDASARVGFFALSVTLFGVTTLSYLTSYVDTLFLGLFRPEQIVGEYSSAMNLTRLLLVGTGTVTFIYLPVTSRLRRERDFPAMRQTYVTVTRWMALLTLPLTFIFVFDPVFSLAFTFGRGQTGGSGALQLLVLATTASVLIGPSTSTLGGLGEVRQVLQFTAYSTVANVALCLALIPTYGMTGAAIAWSAARLLFPTLALLRVFAEHRIHPFERHYLRPLLLAAVVLVPIYLLVPAHPSLWLVPTLVALPFVVLAGAILLTRSVEPADVYFARAAEARARGPGRLLRRLLESRLAEPLPATDGSALGFGSGPR